MEANDNQVGGDHYKSEYQHWDFVEDTKLPYLLAQITRYASRWRKKNGLEDLQKARHYVQKEKETHQQRLNIASTLAAEFCKANNCGTEEVALFRAVMIYHTGNFQMLQSIDKILLVMKEQLHGRHAVLDPEFLQPSDEWKNK